MKISVIILNWNGRELLEKFLPGVIRYSKDAEIIVADNASDDDSIEWITTNHPEVKLIMHTENKGYAGGYNAALEQVDADIFVLLNSDVEVNENWLEPVIDRFKKDESVAVIQPKLRWYHQRDHFEYAGASGGYIDWLGYPYCRGRIFQTLEKDSGQYDDPAKIFWASGACMFIRKKQFQLAGGFDELFFAHMEEIDLCWRIRNLGFEIECVPDSHVHHMGGATLDQASPRKTYLNFRNNLSMLYKNLPYHLVFPVIIMRLVLDGLAGLKFLAEGDFGDCLAVIRAHFHFYKRVADKSLKRQQNTDGLPATVRRKSIILSYFVRRKKHFSELN